MEALGEPRTKEVPNEPITGDAIEQHRDGTLVETKPLIGDSSPISHPRLNQGSFQPKRTFAGAPAMTSSTLSPGTASGRPSSLERAKWSAKRAS